jgi:hypothetical protein
MLSCKVKAINYLGMEEWRVSQVGVSQVTIETNLKFNNPNNFGGLRLNSLDLDVLSQNQKLGVIQAANGTITIPANSEFSIPVAFSFSPSDLLSNIEKIGGILQSLFNQRIPIQTKGNVNFGYAAFNFNKKIDETRTIDLKK